MNPSTPMSLNKVDYTKIGKDIMWFSLVPLTFYITSVLGVIELPGHVIALKDFIPSNATIIAIVCWVLNQLLNLIRKYIA